MQTAILRIQDFSSPTPLRTRPAAMLLTSAPHAGQTALRPLRGKNTDPDGLCSLGEAATFFSPPPHLPVIKTG